MKLYSQFLQRWYPKELQTKCEALAKFRYRRLVQKSHRGCKIIERQRFTISKGKATIFWSAEFRRTL